MRVDVEGMKWLEEIERMAELETQEALETRTNQFIWDSIPREGEFWTSDSVERKVYPEWEPDQGKLKQFFGNTMVFQLNDDEISYVKDIQDRLKSDCKEFLAEPLVSSTFHMTLHDLVNSDNYFEIERQVKATGFAAISILERLKRMEIPPIYMESTCVFNMNSTSVVLGLKPADEESCRWLMLLFELFQSVVGLKNPLTPHITLAYYRPGKYKAEVLEPLRVIIDEVKQKEKLRLKLDITRLVYQEFFSMNHYVEKTIL